MSNGDEPIVPPALNEDLGNGAVPGQVIVRVADSAVAGTGSNFLSQLPVYGQTSDVASVPTSTGIPDLDQVLQSINVQGLYRVWAGDPDSQGGVASGDVGDAFAQLESLMVVQFDPNSASVDSAMAALGGVSSVAEVSPSGIYSVAFTPNDPEFPQQWGLAHINCPDAWDTTVGDPMVTVAVIDTGCDLSHPDLSAQYQQGFNFVSPGSQPQDDFGHGTHVGGTIGAIGNNGNQVAGVTWRCRLLPVKALDSTGHVVGISVAQAIAWATPRCWIINLSLQGLVNDLTLRAAIWGAWNRGVIVCAAMGNYGWDETHPSYPAAYAASYENVIAVGAVDASHRRSVWSATQSSNTGSWIGVVAPGTNILSTANGGGTTTMGGTSMACPHVAGLAALIWSTTQSIGAKGVIDTIKSTATPLRDNSADPVPNSTYGYGLIDVKAAVAAVAPAPAAPVGDFPTPSEQPGVLTGTVLPA
jgi:subtilisin family serine protease